VTAVTLLFAIGGMQAMASASVRPDVTFVPGSYTLTYLSGPSHTPTGVQCLDFTLSAGSVDGFAKSGTWVATTFAGFSGNWVQDGSDLRFYGTYGSGEGVIAHHVKVSAQAILKGGFDDFNPLASGAAAANDGRITLQAGCAGPMQGSRTASPSGAARASGRSVRPAAIFVPGSYTLTYLSGPSHTPTGVQCLQFTQSTGSIVGFKRSGTWVATTFGGFSGNWVEDGSDLRFYGTFGSGTGVIAHHVTVSAQAVLKGGFDDFAPLSSGATANNDGRITLQAGCAAPARTRPGLDPSH
jgi:hypothetical protein